MAIQRPRLRHRDSGVPVGFNAAWFQGGSGGGTGLGGRDNRGAPVFDWNRKHHLDHDFAAAQRPGRRDHCLEQPSQA